MVNSDLSTFSPSERAGHGQTKTFESLPAGSKIVVAGAGVFGGWTALLLQRKRFNVTLFDCWGPGNSLSSSGGETRLIRAMYGDNRRYFEMSLRAWDGWREIEKATGTRLMHHTGILWMFDTKGVDMVDQMITVMEERNHPFELLTAGKARLKYPAINMEGLDNLVFEKQAGYLEARKACGVINSLFIKEGGTYRQGQVKPGSVRNGSMTDIYVNDRKLSADGYVFACGPWLKQLFPELFSHFISVTRQEVHYFGVSPDYVAQFEQLPPWINLESGEFFYGIPGNDYRGFKIAYDKRGKEIDPTTMDRRPDQNNVETVLRFLAKRFPKLAGAPLVESRICQYANTPDGNFIIDVHPDAGNVLLLGGGSGHGFKHGPVVGEMVAGVLSGNRPLDLVFAIPSDFTRGV